MNCCSMTTREAAKLNERMLARVLLVVPCNARYIMSRAFHALSISRPDIEEDAYPPVALDSLAGCG